MSIGGYATQASVYMSFKAITYGFGVPSNVYAVVKKYLGVDHNNKVACSTRTVINLQINGKNWVVGPDVYADLSNRNGRCLSRVYDNGGCN